MNDPIKLKQDLYDLIEEINDKPIRDFTRRMVDSVTCTWECPSSSAHHLPDEREDYGNLLHTIRVASICKLMSEAVMINIHNCMNSDDILLSAAIIHDICKHGLYGLEEKPSPDHPMLVRELAESKGLTCYRFNEIMEVVESHMGKWSENSIYLVIDASTALHLADCIVARWADIMPSGNKEEQD